MSMNPGATAQPDASSSRLPRRVGPISAITPSAMVTSAARPGPPVPSKTVPPRMTRSAAIDHELEQVPVGVAHVHARRRGAPATVPQHRALLDLGPHLAEEGVQRFG